MEKKSFVMYKDWGNYILNLPNEMAGELSKMIMSYAIVGEYIESSNPAITAMFAVIKDKIDEDYKKYLETCERNRRNRNGENDDIDDYEDEEEQNVTSGDDSSRVVTSGDESDYDYHNHNHISSPKRNNIQPTEIDTEIIDYLNTVCDKHYRTTKGNIKYIHGRLKDGYSADDLKTVIDNKAAEWKGDVKWDKYLRPQTLFAPEKFDSYLNEKPKTNISIKDKWGLRV